MGCCCYTAIAALITGLQVVCDFCHEHLEANKQAYADPRLHLLYNDAREELELYEGKFDVIIGDLADPVDGGPCYQVMLRVNDLPFRQVLGAVLMATRPGMLQPVNLIGVRKHPSWQRPCQLLALTHVKTELTAVGAHILCVPAAAALYAGLL